MLKSKNAQIAQRLQRDELIAKIREKFAEAEQKYGKRFFNLEMLEERIAIVNKFQTSIDDFIRAEYEFFTQATAKAEEELQKAKEKEELQQKFDKIVEQNDSKMKVFEDIFFDPRASLTMRYFCGAIKQFFDQYYGSLQKLYRGSLAWKAIDAEFAQLERFRLDDRNHLTIFLKQYVDALPRMTYAQQEEQERKMLQTGGLAVYKIMITLQNTLEAQKHPNEFSQIAQKAHSFCIKILEAFRITSLVEHEYFRTLPK